MKNKESLASILVKLGAIVSFLGGIVGGAGVCSLALSGEVDNWDMFWLGIGLVMLGFFTTAVLAQHIAKFDGDSDFKYLTIGKSIKGGLMFAFFASFFVFLTVGLYFWTERGNYRLGIAGIVGMVVMIFIAVQVSVHYQLSVVKKALNDPQGTEFTATLIAIEPHFFVQCLKWMYVIFYRCVIDANGIRTVTYLRRNNSFLRRLREGDTIKVKMNKKDPTYCAIVK